MAVKLTGPVRLERREAVGMEQLIEEYIRDMKLSSGLNEQRVFAAWDEASGAGPYTLGKSFRKGVLYCNLSSSALRQRLFFQRTEILRKMNEILKEDSLYTKVETSEANYVKYIILK